MMTRGKTLVHKRLSMALRDDDDEIFLKLIPEVKDAWSIDRFLVLAVLWSRQYAVDWLLKRGANPNAEPGCSLLYHTASDVYTTQVLLGYGADPNIANVKAFRDTPIFEAVRRTDGAVVRLLLIYGANPNVKNENGDTPLKCALRVGEWLMALYLVAMGAQIDPNAKIMGDLQYAFFTFVSGTKRLNFYKFCLYIYGKRFSEAIYFKNMFLLNTPAEMNELIRYRDHGLTLQETAAIGLKIAKARHDILVERERLKQ